MTLKPPYQLIREGLTTQNIIPFLGSGASRGGAVNSVWDPATRSNLPTARELAEHLARRTNFPIGIPQELATVAQYYSVINGRDRLVQDLRPIFDHDYDLPAAQRYLATLDGPLLCVTTNYDDLLERAMTQESRQYDLVVHTTDQVQDYVWWRKHGDKEPARIRPNRLVDIDLNSTSVIYKMHGAVDRNDSNRDQYVITEDDYIDFLARMIRQAAIPAGFAEAFGRRHFLFLGHGLHDWNLRVVLNRIDKQLRRPKRIMSWAIQRDPSPLESRFWQDRGVEVFNMPIDEFIQELRNC